MTDDEIRAEVEAMLASGDNGEGAAIEGDYLLSEFDAYWTSINLPGPDSPLFKPYIAAYDAARRAFEAGWDARAKFFPTSTDLTRASGSAVVSYVTTAGSPERMPPL